MTPLPPPETPWLDRLRRGNLVWLVKEGHSTEVTWSWEPPGPGYKTGSLGVSCSATPWYVDNHGRGINGSQILAPVEGHLPENPEPLPEPEVRHIHRQLEDLERRLTAIEQRMASSRDSNFFVGPGRTPGDNVRLTIEDNIRKMLDEGLERVDIDPPAEFRRLNEPRPFRPYAGTPLDPDTPPGVGPSVGHTAGLERVSFDADGAPPPDLPYDE